MISPAIASILNKAKERNRSVITDPSFRVQVDLADWIEKNFYIPELNGPIRLAPYQKAVLNEACRVDNKGQFVYNLILWSDIKKTAKSSIAAAVALGRAFAGDWRSVKVVANDLKQADSRVASYLRRAINLNPFMRDIRQVGYKVFLPNNSVIEAIPIDPSGEAGGNDDLIIFSELWAAKHKAIQQMWTEMTLSPTKFGKSQRWIETYAGYSGESPILEMLYDRGVGSSDQDRIDKGIVQIDKQIGVPGLKIFASAGMLALWNGQPRLTWLTAEYYQEESKTLHPDEFNRVHRNQWASSTNAFIPMAWWHACEIATLPAFRQTEPVILALDAGVSDDCFAIVGITNRGDHCFIRYAQAWTPPTGGKIDYQGTPDQPGPELEILRLCKAYNVVEVRYDPHQLHDMATRLSRQARLNMVEFKQGEQRLRSDKQWYDRIREIRVSHTGDPYLTEHIQNSNGQRDNERLRIVKRSPALKIDLNVAASMATYTDPKPKKSKPGILSQGKARGW